MRKCGFWAAPRAPWRRVAGELGSGGTLLSTCGCTGAGHRSRRSQLSLQAGCDKGAKGLGVCVQGVTLTPEGRFYAGRREVRTGEGAVRGGEQGSERGSVRLTGRGWVPSRVRAGGSGQGTDA